MDFVKLMYIEGLDNHETLLSSQTTSRLLRSILYDRTENNAEGLLLREWKALEKSLYEQTLGSHSSTGLS